MPVGTDHKRSFQIGWLNHDYKSLTKLKSFRNSFITVGHFTVYKLIYFFKLWFDIWISFGISGLANRYTLLVILKNYLNHFELIYVIEFTILVDSRYMFLL